MSNNPISRNGFVIEKIETSGFSRKALIPLSRNSTEIEEQNIFYLGRARFLRSRPGTILGEINLTSGTVLPGTRYINLSSVRIPFFPVLKPTSGNSGLHSSEKSVLVEKVSDYELYNVSWVVAIKDPKGTKFRLINDRSAGKNETVSLVFPDVKSENKPGNYCTEQIPGTAEPTWNLYAPGSENPVIKISSLGISSFNFSSGWNFDSTKNFPTKESSIRLTRLDRSPLNNDLELYVFCIGTVDKDGKQPDIIASKTTISPGTYSSSSIVWRTY